MPVYGGMVKRGGRLFMKRTMAMKISLLFPKDLSVRMKSSMWTAMLLILISGLFALTFVPDVQIVSVDDEWYKARGYEHHGS